MWQQQQSPGWPCPGLCRACPQLGFTVACTFCSAPACCLSGDSAPYVCHFILIHLACHLKAVLIITSAKVYSTRSADCALITKTKTCDYSQSKSKTQYLAVSSSWSLFGCFNVSHTEICFEMWGIQNSLCLSLFFITLAAYCLHFCSFEAQFQKQM